MKFRRRISVGASAGHVRRLVHQALNQERRFGPAGAAIGVGRHAVGEDAFAHCVDCLDIVDAGHHHDREPGNDRAELVEVRAHVGGDLDPEREDAAIRVERHLPGRDVVAAMRVGEEMLAPVRHPFHRPAELLDSLHDKRIFPVVETLRAEPAADIGRKHMHGLRIGLQDFAHRVAHAMHALRADGDGVPIAGALSCSTTIARGSM